MPKPTPSAAPPTPPAAPAPTEPQLPEARPRHVGAHRAVAVVLLIAGVACWLTAGERETNGVIPVVVAAVAGLIGLAVALLPASREFASRAIERLRRPSPKARAIVATVLGLGSAYYLLATATSAGRAFRPVIHDEYCYLIQTHMLADRGRLWMPRHPMGEHFESFHLITDRVYAPKYTPGTALLCAPADWVGLPPGMACLALTAASVALLYLVLCQTVDGLAGLLGALMLPAVPSVRRVSIEVLSQAPMLFLTLLAFWAFLHWRRGRRWGWLATAWAAVGWGLITRPVDGASVALAMGLGMILTWWAGRSRTAAADSEPQKRARLAWEVAIPVLALTPFLALQLICNKGITGHWFELPWAYYGARHDPYDTLSVAPSPPGTPFHPTSAVPQVRVFPETISEPAYRAKVAMSPAGRVLGRTLAPLLRHGLPNPLLLVLLPVAFLALGSRGRWIPVVAFAAFVLVYSRYTYFLVHYVTSVAPAMMLMVLVGWHALAGLWGRTGATAVQWAGGAAIFALTLTALPQLRADPPAEEWDVAPVQRLVDDLIADAARPPAIVLFRADPARVNLHIEPAYNADVAWPDDAPVVRAHDLGPERNRELFAYYAQRSRERGEPDRGVYLYDLSPETITRPPTYLGTAGELAGRR